MPSTYPLADGSADGGQLVAIVPKRNGVPRSRLLVRRWLLVELPKLNFDRKDLLCTAQYEGMKVVVGVQVFSLGVHDNR